MKVVSLTYYSRSNLVLVTLDSNEKIPFDAEFALEKGIGQGVEFDKNLIKNYQEQSITKRLHKQAFGYLSIRQRSKVELIRYLEKKLEKSLQIFKTVLPETGRLLINDVITDLETRKYLDDEEFAKNYISSKLLGKGKGKRALAYNLDKKGIAKNIIDNLLHDESVLPKETTDTLIDKSIENISMVIRSRALDKRKAREMMTRRLLTRGFSYDEIRTKIDDWLRDEYNR